MHRSFRATHSALILKDEGSVLVWPVVADLGAPLRDQPGAALLARVDPQPVDRDAEPVAQADQEIDVGDAPDPPRQRAAQFYAPEIDHRQPLADLRQVARMLVRKRRKRFATQPC